jgi:hypothetical protein
MTKRPGFTGGTAVGQQQGLGEVEIATQQTFSEQLERLPVKRDGRTYSAPKPHPSCLYEKNEPEHSGTAVSHRYHGCPGAGVRH